MIRPMREVMRVHPVWGLNLALFGVMIAACIVALAPGEGALAGDGVPWWAVALLLAATERWPVHLQFRRSAHSFSMTDIPLVLALVFASPAAMIVGVAVGTGIAMSLRRLPPIKLAFNLLQFVFCAALAIVVLRLWVGPRDADLSLETCVAVAVSLQLSGVVGMALVGAAILLSEGGITREQVRQMFNVDAVVTLTNTCLALLLAILLIDRPEAIGFVGVPVAVVYGAYRLFAGERERREKLQFLYEVNRKFLAAPEVTEAVATLLERALAAFRVEHGEIVLFGAEPGSEPLRVAVGMHGAPRSMAPVEEPGAAELLALVVDARQPVRLGDQLAEGARVYPRARGVRSGAAAVLRGEERAVGFLLLANRSGVDQQFSADDLELVETLAANASAALQYDRLEQTVAELRALQERLHHQAFHDGLTGLANRALFHQEVGVHLAGASEAEVAVLFFDLDDFKAVNDTYGHALGDELLAGAADRLRACLATLPKAVLARLGGDEFAVLLSAPAGIEEQAATTAQRILDAFRAPVQASGRPFTLGLSLGVATSRHSGGHAPDLLRDADVAMYEAKATGKGRWSVFDPAMRDALLERHGLRAELEHAIAAGELVVHFQPIFDVASGRPAAVEALVRWEHPVRGRIPPLAFIPVAEESGLILPLGRFVLREACRHAAGWRTAGLNGGPLAVHVNLSARELEDPEIIASVSGALAEWSVAPQQLVLELTESLLVQDARRGARTLTGLRGLGVRLALDDFGTGFSSLNYLRTLPLDQLKIAREFVDGLGENRDDQTFVRLILELAHTIGLQVVAEGVETALQLDELRGLGCDFVQGYHLGRPAPAAEAVPVAPPAEAV